MRTLWYHPHTNIFGITTALLVKKCLVSKKLTIKIKLQISPVLHVSILGEDLNTDWILVGNLD